MFPRQFSIQHQNVYLLPQYFYNEKVDSAFYFVVLVVNCMLILDKTENILILEVLPLLFQYISLYILEI